MSILQKHSNNSFLCRLKSDSASKQALKNEQKNCTQFPASKTTGLLNNPLFFLSYSTVLQLVKIPNSFLLKKNQNLSYYLGFSQVCFISDLPN